MKNFKTFESFVNEKTSKSEFSKIEDYLEGLDPADLKEICDELLIDDEDYMENQHDIQPDEMIEYALDYIKDVDATIKLKDIKSIIESNQFSSINEADVEYEKIEANKELYDIMMKAVTTGYKYGMSAIKKAASADHISMGGKFTYGFRDNVANLRSRVYQITDLYQMYLDKCVEYNENLATHLRMLDKGKSDINMNLYKTEVEKAEAKVRDHAKKVMKDSL